MNNWTWESPHPWVLVARAFFGVIGWIWTTWLKVRPEPCRHVWEKDGEVVKERAWSGTNWVDDLRQPCRCPKCGQIKSFNL